MSNAQIVEKHTESTSDSTSVKIKMPQLTLQKKLNEEVTRVRSAARKFAILSIDKRIVLINKMQHEFIKVAENIVKAGCQAKDIPQGSNLEAEEWATSIWGVVRQMRLIRESLESLEKTENTAISKIKQTVTGRVVVEVFPNNMIDEILFKDVTVDVYMQQRDSALDTILHIEKNRARFYKKPHQGKVVLVLGAGNIASIAIMDVLSKMFNEGKVCILKMNPVNAYLGPLLEKAFKSAIDEHYLSIVYGGVEEGRHLVHHPKVDEIHLTGSDKTYNQILWGSGAEADERRAQNQPLVRKWMTAELGNVSPIIVVPGPYTDKEIRFQAEQIATAFTMNTSFMCCAAKILIFPNNWDGTARFMHVLKQVLKDIPTRKAYYAGAEDRWQAAVSNQSNVIKIGKPKAGELPWTLITDLNPNDANEKLFTEELFCSVIATVQVGSVNSIDFLQKATDFANNRLWGTLNATLIVHPKTLKDSYNKAAFEQAIDHLKYGAISVNTFIGLLFYTGAPWGAYPNTNAQDIQSGNGFVHNTNMLEGIEKAVLRAPLTVFPKPAWLPSHKKAKAVIQNLVAIEENASWAKVPSIIFSAIQG